MSVSNVNQTTPVVPDNNQLSAKQNEAGAVKVEQQAAPIENRSDQVTLSAGQVGADVKQLNKGQAKALEQSADKGKVEGGKTLPPEEVEEQQQTKALDKEQELEQVVEQLNDYVQNIQRELNFSVDKDIGAVVVKVIESSTEEVIRQIPSEDAIKLARNLQEFGNELGDGDLFEAKA